MTRRTVLAISCAARLLLGASDAAADAASPSPTVPDVAPAFREPFFPFLDDEDPTASVSVGETSHGFVVNSKQIVENEAVGILPRQRARDLAWGTDEMIELIQAAGAKLHAATGTRLWIGDIGRRGGGDIFPYSVSHRSGRDADIALSYVDEKGKPVDPPDLVQLDFRGESKDKKLRFDAARTWIVVRSMLEAPETRVQWIFLSYGLKLRLLDHAIRHHEPAEIVARAKEIIWQPTSPHDDHFHVRIYCGARDLGGGCVDRGTIHPWVQIDETIRAGRVEAAVELLDGSRPEVRSAALRRLGVLEAREHVELVAKALTDQAAGVRAAAATTLGALGARDRQEMIAGAFFREEEPTARIAMVEALAQLGGPPAGSVIAGVLGGRPLFCDDLVDRGPDPAFFDARGALIASPPLPRLPLLSVRCEDHAAYSALFSAALEASGYADRLEPIDALLEMLDGTDPALRGRAADALARITNRRFGKAWDDPFLSAADRREGVHAWRKWVDLLRKWPRDAWLASGFVAAGYHVQRLDAEHAWELVRAMPRGDHLSYNAHRVLERIGSRTASVRWSDAAACSDWLGYFGRFRKNFKLEAPPRATTDACARVRARAMAAVTGPIEGGGSGAH